MSSREGSLQQPIRYSIAWKNPDFYNEDSLYQELERVYELCHGCRRCVSLCEAFPTLFDLVDESETMEVDGVDQADYFKVVDHCYLCDLCFMTKCPYVPPHEWNIDFPHLMLRAKAIKHKKGLNSFKDTLLSSSDAIGKLATIPLINNMVNFVKNNKVARKVLDKTLGIHPDSYVPEYKKLKQPELKTTNSEYKIAIFASCFGSYNSPQMVEDLIKILEHNQVEVKIIEDTRCCAMPKLEKGDLKAVEKAKQHNIPKLAELASQGFAITAPIPSCVLMYRQELPLLFADDEKVAAVAKKMVDPFEYLDDLHGEGKLKTDFAAGLGTVVYQQACHQRVQNIGARTRKVLELIPNTTIELVERCSGHDGTYGMRTDTFENAVKIARPVTRKLIQTTHDYYTSDCVIAGHHLENITKLNFERGELRHPFSLLCKAYGI